MRRSKIQVLSKTGSVIRWPDFAFGSPNFQEQRLTGSASRKTRTRSNISRVVAQP